MNPETRLFLKLKYNIREIEYGNAVLLEHDIPKEFFKTCQIEFGSGARCMYVKESVDLFYRVLQTYNESITNTD